MVGFVWSIDPGARTVEAFRRSPDAQWVLVGNFAGSQTARIEPFEAIEIDLSPLWLEGGRG